MKYVLFFIYKKYLLLMSDLKKKDIKDIVNDELKKFIKDSLDKEMKTILQKLNSESRKEMIKTIKDSLESAFKILWVKKDFWKSDIK